MSSLVLIDITCVSRVDDFVACLLPGVEYVTFRFDEPFADVKARIPNKTYTNISLVQHNKKQDYFVMMLPENSRVSRITDVATIDPELKSWVDIQNFLAWLRDERGMKTFDLLACDLWASDDWKYVINTLKSRLNIGIRASIDITGVDGNYMLESDNVDTIGLYFTDAVKSYPQNFYTAYTVSHNQNDLPQFDASCNAIFYKTKYSGNALFTLQQNNSTYYYAQPYDVSNVKQILTGANYIQEYTSVNMAVLRQDGSVVRWGAIDSTMKYETTTTSPALTNVKRLFSGPNCMVALKNDGTIVAWGFVTLYAIYTNINVSNIFNNAPTADISNIVQIYNVNASWWGVDNIGTVHAWGAKMGGGDISLCKDLLVNVKKVCTYFGSNGGFCALRTDGNIVICGQTDPWNNIPCRYVTTVGNASLSGKIVDIMNGTNGCYAVINNNGVHGIYNIGWTPTENIAKTNTMTLGSPMYVLPAGVTVLHADEYAFFLSNNTIFANNTIYKAGQMHYPEAGRAFGYLTPSGEFMSPLTAERDVRGGYLLTDPTWGLLPSANASSNVVQLYSCMSGYCARKSNGSVITWGGGIVNNPLRYNSADSGIYDVLGVHEITAGYILKRSETLYQKVAMGNGHTTASVTLPTPAGKTLYFMNPISSQWGMPTDTICLEMTPCESVSPSSVMAFSSSTITYYSNKWECNAMPNVLYGLYCNGVLLSTCMLGYKSMTFTFQNVLIPVAGPVTLTIGVAATNVPNTLVSFSMNVEPNPYVSVPDAPTINTVSITSTTSVSVAYSLPSWNGGIAIHAVKYSMDGGATFTTAASMVSPLVLTGITQGAIDFQLVVSNAFGDSYNAGYSIVMCDPPSAPVITSVSGANRKITVGFTPSSTNPASVTFDVAGMVNNVYVMSGNANALVNGQYVASASGYANGSAYTLFDTNNATQLYSDQAYSNPSGIGSYNSYAGSTATAVETVGNVLGEWFQLKFPNPIVLTGYTFSSNVANYFPNTLWVLGSFDGSKWYPLDYRSSMWAGAGNTNTYTVNEAMSAGAFKYFRVIVTAVNGGAQYILRKFAVIGYTALADSVVGYKYSVNGGAYVSKGPRISPLTITTGLYNSTTYNVTMKAINAAGDSVASNTSANVTLIAYVPEAPVLLTATSPSPSTIVFTFQPPYNGGSPITKYQYVYNGTYVDLSTNVTSVTITGLTNGTNYTIGVIAVNALGSSAMSNVIENVMPKDVPGKPGYRNTYVRNGAAIVQLSTGPANGVPITSVLYNVNDGPYLPVYNWDNLLYVDITGLTNGTEYAVRFVAVNALGRSVPSDPAYVTPCDIPMASTITSVVAVDGVANVSFTPGFSNGSPILQYEYMLNNPYPNAINSMLFTGSRWITVPANSDLNLGTDDFTIEWWQYLPWEQSFHSRIFSFGKDSTGIPLCFKWYDDQNTGHSTFMAQVCINNVWHSVAYKNTYEHFVHVALSRVSGVLRVFMDGVQVGVDIECLDDISPNSQLVIGNDESFEGGPQYFGIIHAFTYIKGWGKYDASANFTPPLDLVKSVPQGTLVLFIIGNNNPATGSLGNTAVIPTFESWGTMLPAGYFNAQFVVIPNDLTSPVTISGLTNGQDYTAVIRSKNQAGYSASSNSVAFKPMSVPSAPVINSVAYGNHSAVLDFTANVTSGNSPILGYKLSTNGGAFVSIGMISSPYTVTGLVNGTTYSFQLKAVSSIGDSPSSVSSSYVVPHRVPDAPVISVIDNVLQATVSFVAGASNGGSELLSYTYSYDNGDGVTLLAPQDQTYSLVLGETHTFSVYATNDAGNSAVSTVTLVGRNLPDAPVIDGIDAGDKSAHVSFTAGSSNYSDITGYKYKLDAGEWQDAVLSNSSITIGGLSANQTYSVTIVAINGVGMSEASNAWSVTPYTKPDPVTLDSVQAGDATITFSFTPGVSNNSPITSYKYSLNNKPYVVLPDLLTTVTLSDLSNGILYNLKIKATNAAGDSSSSNAMSAMPYTIPEPPTIYSVTAGNESVEVYFTAGFFNGSNISGYKYALNGGSFDGTVFVVASGLSSPLYIDGLVNGTVYSVMILAVNEAGESNASNASSSFVPFVTQSTANPPLLQGSTVSNGSVLINYVDDVNLGSAIIGYRYSLNNGPYYWFAQTSSPLEIHGLENGLEYSVTVKSVNNSGASHPSPALLFTPCDVPSAPIITNGVAGDQQITLYLSDLVDNGSAITDVQCSLNDGEFFSVTCTAGVIVVQSLVNGTDYTARVQCVNALGVSAVSNVSEVMRTVGLPFPPTITNMVVGDEMVTVYFDQADGNGLPVLKYSYCLIDNGVAGLYLSTEDLTSPIVIAGLTNGHTYALRMKSLTHEGESVATTESEDFVPYGMPLAPIITKALYASDVLTVHFTEVSSNGKAIVDHLYSLDGITYFSSSQLSSPLTISNLAIGSSSTVFIQTQTDAGISPASNESDSFIAYSIPTSPLITGVTSLNQAVSVAFVDGSFNGTTKIGHKYSVDGTNFYWCNTDVSPILITGLENGTAYHVSLKTVTNQGETDFYTFATAVTPSNMQLPPNIINVDVSNASVIVGFNNPQLNGATITGYLYSLNGGEDMNGVLLDASSNKLVISGLTNGTAYTVSIKSVSANGTSGSSNVSKTFTPYSPPSAPVISKVVTGSQIANVYFTDGSLNGSPAILGYKYSLDGVNYTWSAVTTSPIPLTGLTNSIAYTVRLVAVTSVNQSVPSAASAGFVPYALPNPPVITSAVVGTGSATITFTDGATNGRPLTGYKYSLNGGALTSVTTTNGSFTVTGLTVGTSYYVSMFAVNAAGTSIASVPSSTFMPYSVPGAPSIVSIQPAEKSAIVTIDNASLNGTDFNGIPITGYKWAFSEAGPFYDVAVSPNATTFTVLGLQNGVSYQICVKSVCSVGVSPASSLSASFSPCTVPQAPTVTSLVPFDERAQLYYTDGSNNGTPITGYKYSFDGITYYTALQKTSPLTLFSLTNSTSYQVYLKATNIMGDSSNSNLSDAAVPFGVPFAPTITDIVPGNGCAYVYFNPINDNGSPITLIRYSLGAAAMDASGVTSPVTIPNLVNKTAYNVAIIACNAAGESYGSNIVQVISGVPTKPVVTATESSAKTVKVYFDIPVDNGSAITGYQWAVVGSTKFNKAMGVASPLTLTGLTNGLAYNIVISAVNKNGMSFPSVPLGNRIPFDFPGKFTITNVVPRFGSALVNFKPPADNGSAIYKYMYTISTDATATYYDLSGLTSPLEIANTPNNALYSIKLKAYNQAGASLETPASKPAQYIYLPPVQPKITAVTANYQTLFIALTAPAIRGSAISGYKYSLNGGEYISTGTSTPIMVTGVQNNTAYTVTLIACSDAGDSVASVAAKPVSYVYLPPTAPTVSAIAGGNQSAVVTFTDPKIFNSPVTGYKYTLNGGAMLDASGLVSPLTITGLTNDVSYNVVLYANSGAGLSPASIAKLVTPVYNVPGVPVVKSVIVSTDTASITLTLGAANGAPITSVMYSLDNGATYVDSGSLTGAFVVTGLVSKQTYNLKAYTVNAVGSSAVSAVKTFIMK